MNNMETIKLSLTAKKVIFFIGVCLLIDYSMQFKCCIEYIYARNHSNFSQAFQIAEETQTWLSVLIWAQSFLYVCFFVGIIAIVVKKKLFFYFISMLLIPEVLSVTRRIIPEPFNYSFTPEGFHAGLYSLSLISLAITSVLFVYLAIYSQRLYKHGLIIFSLIMSISLIWMIGIGLIFSIDSSYFFEKFPTFFILRSFYYDYLQYPLYIIATLILVIAIYKDAYKEITAEELLAE